MRHGINSACAIASISMMRGSNFMWIRATRIFPVFGGMFTRSRVVSTMASQFITETKIKTITGSEWRNSNFN